jgi:hypothetical protein
MPPLAPEFGTGVTFSIPVPSSLTWCRNEPKRNRFLDPLAVVAQLEIERGYLFWPEVTVSDQAGMVQRGLVDARCTERLPVERLDVDPWRGIPDDAAARNDVQIQIPDLVCLEPPISFTPWGSR